MSAVVYIYLKTGLILSGSAPIDPGFLLKTITSVGQGGSAGIQAYHQFGVLQLPASELGQDLAAKSPLLSVYLQEYPGTTAASNDSSKRAVSRRPVPSQVTHGLPDASLCQTPLANLLLFSKYSQNGAN